MRSETAQRPNPQGESPRVSATAYLDPSSVVIGNVRIDDDVFVGPGAVIRADEPGSSIEVGRGSNVQDRVVIHALEGSSVSIGERVSLAHACVVHGPCVIGAGCFVGFGSIVFRASLGEGVVVKHLAVVEGVEVEPERVIGSGSVVDTAEKARGLGLADEETRDFTERVAAVNLSLKNGYLDGRREKP